MLRQHGARWLWMCGSIVVIVCSVCIALLSWSMQTAFAESPIQTKYLQLGGASGFLGKPVTAEKVASDGIGHYVHYLHGSIYWTPQTGAHEIHGLIREKWAERGKEKSLLKYPISDQKSTSDGAGYYNLFQGGVIYWSQTAGAHTLISPIFDKWIALGRENSYLGYLVKDDAITPDKLGHFNRFQDGSIYWTAKTGAHAVQGPIQDKWASLGWERSWLGYPTSDEQEARDGIGRISYFQHGSIYWSQTTGTIVSA